MIKLLTLALVATTAWAANKDHVLIFSLNSGQSEAPIGDKGVRFTVQELLCKSTSHAYCSAAYLHARVLSPYSTPGARVFAVLPLPTPCSLLPLDAVPRPWVFPILPLFSSLARPHTMSAWPLVQNRAQLSHTTLTRSATFTTLTRTTSLLSLTLSRR